MTADTSTQLATFAAGCFWGVEDTFRKTEGVIDTRVGYLGGFMTDPEPTYESVCSGRTGHAEAVEVRFDLARVSYNQLLALFFSLHDPTTLNRQGPDIGSQYRSAIFTHNDEQLSQATQMVEELTKNARFTNPIVTKIEPAPTFFAAEDYHQQYVEKKGGHCSLF